MPPALLALLPILLPRLIDFVERKFDRKPDEASRGIEKKKYAVNFIMASYEFAVYVGLLKDNAGVAAVALQVAEAIEKQVAEMKAAGKL